MRFTFRSSFIRLYLISEALHKVITNVWSTGRVPAEWKEGIIVSLYKGKGSQSECGSYRPISLLSVSGKVFAHILLARIQPLIDKCRFFNRQIDVAYIDIKSAFDSVDRVALWKALR